MWLETVSLPPVALQDFLQIQPREFVKLAHLIAVHAQDQIHLSGVRAAAAPYFFNQVLVFQHVHLATISSVQPQSVASVLSVQVVPVTLAVNLKYAQATLQVLLQLGISSLLP